MSEPPVVPLPTLIMDLPRTVRRPLVQFGRYLDRYGDNFLLRSGSRRTHLTADADVIQHVLQRNHRNYEKSEIQTEQMARYIGHGLLTNSGEDWLRQRRLIQPGFHRRRLAGLEEQMRGEIDSACGRLRTAADGGATVALNAFCRDTVFNVIARAIFTDGFSAEETAELYGAIDAVQGYVIYPIRMPWLRGVLSRSGIDRRFLAKSQRVRELIGQRIVARRAGAERDDLLQMLLESRYADTDEPITDEKLIDEIVILFAAGHETTANALAWTLWLLLRHPEELKLVTDQARNAPATDPAAPDPLTRTVEEAMRLYPPAWITDRKAHAGDEIGPYSVRSGTVISPYFYGLHRNPRYWGPDAEDFRPERMAPELKKERHPFCYLPFGGGPRLCIGNHFAMLEMQLFLRTVLGEFDLSLDHRAGAVRPQSHITLGMDREVQLGVARA